MGYVLKSTEKVYMSVKSPFGDKVILTKFEGTEKVSELFHFTMTLCSQKSDLSFNDIVGKSITAIVENNKGKRCYNGLVSSFRQLDTVYNKNKGYARTYYEAQVVPAFWKLTLTEDCRIFQEKSANDIIKDILKKNEVHISDKVESAGKEKMDFCVQFNESDFAFVCRLMEANGIFYFFKHEDGKHTMYLGDSSSAFESCSDASEVPFIGHFPPGKPVYGIEKCYAQQQVTPKEYSTKDFNFEKPTTDMFAKTKGKGKGGVYYHYPGHYWSKDQEAGEKITKVHIESLEAPGETAQGESNVPFLEAGSTFKMKDHPRNALNGDPMVLHRVHHYAELKADQANTAGEDFDPDDLDELVYKNTFEIFPKKTIYRPPIRTPIPVMPTQTAIVTGKEDEEIWTDKYGRIKVKFHWDTSDTKHDKTSCWIRVMQAWTGKKWGFLFIPRIGQEVIVQFINGSPDHPLITGCVYNHENTPPYLPDEPTKSTIKTHSTKKGKDGFNEIRFEDKKDKEQLYMHAQKDMLTEVKHDKTTTIEKGDRAYTIKKGNETKTLKEGNSTTTLEKGDEKRTLKKGNQTLELKDGKRDITVEGGDETHTNKKNYTHKVSKNYELKVKGDLTIDVTGSITIKSGSKSITISAVQGIKVKSDDSVKIKGTAGVDVNSTAEVKIKGTAGVNVSSTAAVNIKGTASVGVKSSAALSLSGGAEAKLSGGGMCMISGGIVNING